MNNRDLSTNDENSSEKKLQIERYLYIYNLLKQKNTVLIGELSRILHVSTNTIRRDLSNLEKQGLLKRTHGGAIFADSYMQSQPYEMRSKEGMTEKEKIGRMAASLIRDGSTVIIDAGTTTKQLALYLKSAGSLTVLTNSLEIAEILSENANIIVILSGGILQVSSQHLVGMPAEQFFNQVHVDQLFTSANAISIEKGMLSSNLHIVPIKQKMIDAAREIILIADSSKFDKTGIGQIAPLTAVHKLITDSGIEPQTASAISALGIEVIIAE
ncbi:MAG: DeoR/GlpR transcriptional regulator [Spirochaetaceae bacterium]|nr:MAG: DeoR/GlpR transcriptional regulator [Spirochaetaceae bacterium]